MKLVVLCSIFLLGHFSSADSLLNLQWSLKNSGVAQVVDLDPVRNYRVSARSGEDIRLPKNNPLSPRQVLVAVLDTGIDRNHPDLKNIIREKPIECKALAQYLQCLENDSLKNCDKKWMDLNNAEVDMDKNGYPMDCYGWSAIGPQSEVTQIVGSPFFVDNIGHGTHVAGIVGAETGNAIGIRGVSAHIRILPVQVIDDRVNEPLKPMSAPNLDPGEKIRFEQGYKLVQDVSDRVARGFLYALNEGAEVISMSLGWPQVADSKLFRELIKEANRRGVIVVAAAGNDSTRALLRPCVYDGVICVGSLNPDGSLSHFSNYGSGVDIAAPGLSILSTYPEDMRPVRFRSNLGFEYLSGTSQATPLVAGAVAELLSRGIPAHEIYARLIHSARPLKSPTALFQVFASGESQLFQADNEPLKKYILSGQLDIQKALEIPFRALVIASQRSRPEILWNGKSSVLHFNLEMINRGAPISSNDVKINVKVKGVLNGAVRPQVKALELQSQPGPVWQQNETRIFKVQLEMPQNRVRELPADLDLEVVAQYSNGFEQLSVVEPEVLQDLSAIDSNRKKEMLISGLPFGQWDWTPLESLDGSQRGEVYLLTEQEGQGFRVATARIVNDKMEIKGPVTLPGTRGLKLVAVMWGAWTGQGAV
ncbi:MAG: S8 family serine peptidase, partial [Bdellovibrionales bacterium]